jgi:SAM-dependent methyltransferase
MRNVNQWSPSKFIEERGQLRADRSGKYVYTGSWLIAELVADCYQQAKKWLKPGLIVDLGCGRVPLYGFYSGVAESVVCLDWPSTIHSQIHVDCYADLNRGLPLKANVADTVILSDVLEHVYEHQKLLCEVARIMRNDGVLLLNVPFLYRIHEAPHDYYRYTEFSLRRILAGAGLIVIELKSIGGILEVLVDLTAKMLAELPILGAVIARLLQNAVLFLERIPTVRRLTSRSSTSFPLGYFVVAKRAV